MNEFLDLRAELILAARQCGLAEEGNLPPVVFHYIEPKTGHRGHLSTPWAFSLSGVEAEEAAKRIARTNPNWEAQDGYLNITLTAEQMDRTVRGLAADFDARRYAFVRPCDGKADFLMQYFIYLAVQEEIRDREQRLSAPLTEGERALLPVVVYASLGGSGDLLAQKLYAYYRSGYREGLGLCLPAAAEIFANQLYKEA